MAALPVGRPRNHAKTNLEAAMVTIRALEGKDGRNPADEALVTYILTTAEAVDGPKCGALLRKEYREALGELIARHERAGDGDADILAGVFSAVGDSTKRTARHLRAADGGDRQVAGHAADAMATPGRRRRAGTAA